MSLVVTVYVPSGIVMAADSRMTVTRTEEREEDGTEFVYPLGRHTTIGRAPDNDIVLGSATVSGYHAEIRYENGQYVLHDKNSRNGTYVNGRRIVGPNLIKPGWRITIGDVDLTVGS